MAGTEAKGNPNPAQKPVQTPAIPATPAPVVAPTSQLAPVTSTLEPKVLAARMGISPKRLRAMLRSTHPRGMEVKGQKWEIPMDLAKTVEAEYKAKKVAKEAPKQEEIQKQLAGEGKA